MTDYKAYKTYMALKTHFNDPKYNIVEMKGRIKTSQQGFAGSGKAFSFRRLVKLYKDKEVIEFMIANFIKGDRWGGVFDAEASKNYQDWKRRKESLSYVFKEELSQVIDEARDVGINNIIETNDSHDHPYIVKSFMRGSISPETLVIVNKLTSFADKVSCQDPFWNDVHKLIIKYSPFVKVDLTKYQETYKNING